MKWRHRALVIVGSVAVIATSQMPAWELWSNEAPIAQVTLDNQTPQVRYAVHAELRGPGPFEGLDGWVAVHLDLSQPTAITTIEIRSITHPDVMPTTTPADTEAFMDAWLDCSSDPCAEDFEIAIRREPSANEIPLQVTGYIHAYANSSTGATETPKNSEIVVSVTGPL
jgi:hypothetical protein